MKELKWKEWRPARRWVMVKADPRVKKTKGGIYLTDELTMVERVMEGTGKVLKVGSDVREVLGVPLEPGQKICYRGFLKDVWAMFERDDDCDIFLLRAEDCLAIVDEEVQMGAFS